MIRVVHLITDLDVGGAETTLVRLLGCMDRSRFDSHVVSLVAGGALERRLKNRDVPVRSLSMRRGRPSPWAVLQLRALLRQIRPDILQTWMYHADVLGIVAARSAGVPNVLWNVRASNLDIRHYGWLTAMTRRAAARLSRQPTAIIVNSTAGRMAHEAIGYRPRIWVLIPNGIDGGEFRPDPAARTQVRRTLGLNDATRLIGLVARFHPMKDHHTFIRAAATLCRDRPDVHVVLVGAGIDPTNRTLRSWVDVEGLVGRVSLLGHRDDVARIDAALDVAVMASSDGEGFPTALAEAMACGVPCVTTDVGDARRVLGETGRVVPPRDSEAMARECGVLLDAPVSARRALGMAARARVLAEYELARITAAYQQMYASLVNG